MDAFSTLQANGAGSITILVNEAECYDGHAAYNKNKRSCGSGFSFFGISLSNVEMESTAKEIRDAELAS